MRGTFPPSGRVPRVLAIVLACVASVALASVAYGQSVGPMCAIDMGSNSFKRIVGTFAAGRYTQRPIERKTLGVGDDVSRNGRISDGKLAEIADALAAFKAGCERDGATPVVAIGTAAFREAPNGRRVVDIAASLGIRMEIASAERESELALLVGTLGRDNRAVIDNGSRSVELVARDNGALRYSVFNQGYRVAYEAFFAQADSARAAVASFRDQLIRDASANVAFMRGKQALVGVEFGEMADILFVPAPLEGRVFTLAQLTHKLEEIAGLGSAAFQTLKQTRDIDRALPRLVVATVLTELFGYSQIELTERELGSGLIIESGPKRP